MISHICTTTNQNLRTKFKIGAAILLGFQQEGLDVFKGINEFTQITTIDD